MKYACAHVFGLDNEVREIYKEKARLRVRCLCLRALCFLQFSAWGFFFLEGRSTNVNEFSRSEKGIQRFISTLLKLPLLSFFFLLRSCVAVR